MQEFADQDVEVLDVLFKRTHAGLVPCHVEADVDLVVRGLVLRLVWMKCSFALASLQLEPFLCFTKLALGGTLEFLARRWTRALWQERQIEFGQKRIDQDADDQDSKERRKDQTGQKYASPEAGPALSIRIEEDRHYTIFAHTRVSSIHSRGLSEGRMPGVKHILELLGSV